MLYPRRCILGQKRAVACCSRVHTSMLVVDTELYILSNTERVRNIDLLYNLVLPLRSFSEGGSQIQRDKYLFDKILGLNTNYLYTQALM